KEVIPKIQLQSRFLANMQNFLANNSSLSRNKVKVLIHPGTSQLAIKKGIIKTWNTHYWVHLIKELLSCDDTEIILAGGPDDESTIKDIATKLEVDPLFDLRKDSFISAYGYTKSLADLAALIQLSNLLVCVDSAPMHVAVALDKPVVALFGPTNPDY